MLKSNQKIVDKYFEAYMKHDLQAIKEVMHENVKWYFIGRHPFAGVKNGINEVVSFFDTMGKMMGSSKPTIEKLIVGENENYFIECSHIKTNRPDGINVDHHATVLWTIRDGKIIEGRHFFADPVALDQYFTSVSKAPQ
jgi:ketosteroid isomerase-like protein